ncbi:MAG: type 12 [Desulfobulbaceae bacterium]|nr:MAG: type 12 [Desulfobulbaceae bacterium]
MSFGEVTGHYERHPYPHYPLLASIRRYDTYAMNLTALWARFNGELLPERQGRMLLAGCGAFAPYPMSLANPKAKIIGVDLARNNLRRARLHCLLHGFPRVCLLQGNFLDPSVTPGPFHFIEAFGVLHHLDDPAAGMCALKERLSAGGILRVMVYGRYARQEAESIRRAMRLLRINDIETLKQLIRRALPDSRLRHYIDNSWEARTDSGLADLFLHPNVHTYRIDEFLEMVSCSGLKPLLFTHLDALADVEQEIIRLRELDRRRETLSNIICYLGRDCKGEAPVSSQSYLLLNPALNGAVSLLRLGALVPMSRLGHENPPLDWKARRFLRRFITPILQSSLSPADKELAERYLKELFLVRLNGGK